MSYKEVWEQSKEYLDNPNEYIRHSGQDNKQRSHDFKKPDAKTQVVNRRPTAGSNYWDLVKKIKLEGKEICLEFNKDGGCKLRGCRRAHKCCYMERGETNKVCGAEHSKHKHMSLQDGKP